MSHNQSKAERSESTQYRKTGRSGNTTNQQRHFQGGASTKGGGSAPSNPASRSLKKHNNNAQGGGYSRVRSPNVESEHNEQQPTHKPSDVPAISTSANADGPTQKVTEAAPASKVSVSNPESGVPTTPAKGPGDGSIPLQFGSISPGFINGVQIPARTSSAPPNMDEQKKSQARQGLLRAVPAPALPIPLPKHQAVKKDTQISAAQPIVQTKKPVIHSIPSMPMQMPFQPVHFGGPNPQIPSQAMTMQMPLPLGNPQMQQPMFIPHHMQSQGMIHQGQNFNFSSHMEHQLPHPMGNMGINMTPHPQFPQQQAGKYTSSRKTVKITHPDTHEELRLDGSSGPRSHHIVPPQSQPIPSLPPNHQMNYFSNSYNSNSIYIPTASSVPMNNTQVPPISQPPRLYNQVIIKPPVGYHGEKEPSSATSSISVRKAESGFSSMSTSSAAEARNPAVVLDSIKDKRNELGNKGDTNIDKDVLEKSLRVLSLESSEITGEVVESADKSTTLATGGLLECAEKNQEESVGSCTDVVNAAEYVVASSHPQSDQNIDSSVSINGLSAEDDKISKSDTPLLSALDNTDTVESKAMKSSASNDDTLKRENEDTSNNNGGLDPPSSNVKDKVLSDISVAKSTVPRVKKKKKELLRKAEAAGTSSDLYNAYKGPEEKKENIASKEILEETSSTSVEQKSIEISQSKVEPDDWEDAAEISPQLHSSKNDQDNDNENESMTKKYSRDFLLKFAEQCDDLPEGFEITSDITDVLMASSANVSRNSANVSRNYGVSRNPRAQAPLQYGGGPQGVAQRNNSESDRWQRGTGFHKGLMPYPVMHKAEKKYEIGNVADEEQAKQRQLKGILNKLTPQNFEKLFEQVKQVNIDNGVTLSGVISQIFDKALTEPTFCEMYADFCFHLAADLPELIVENEKITFKRLLLNKCQEEFERGEREEEEANKGEAKLTVEEREEKRLQIRRRMLGNIRLIGELYKKRMLTERIMHECINKLLGQYQNPDEENIEALCKLMSTIGEMIDHPKAKDHIDAYFDIMTQMSNNMNLSSRVRFMLKDSIDLRKNKWQQRRKVEGPKKIDEVHRDAAQERQLQSSRLARGPTMGGGSMRRGPHMDFGPRAPSMLSPPGSQMGGYRPGPPQVRGHGSQDVRSDERHSYALPQSQRPLGDESITLGPHGGLVRGMAFRGPSPGVGPALNGFSSIPAYGQREDLMPRFVAPSNYDQLDHHKRNATHPTSMHSASSEKALPEEHLRNKSLAAIKEFYSARDENEIALCIKDLNTPSFYPSMISIWLTDSFERKETERDLLTKLLLNLSKLRDGLISEDQLIKGFESVLTVLEDAVNDAPKAAEFLGQTFARLVLEKVVSLSELGQLIYEGGEEKGSLVETGIAADLVVSILETIKTEKGDSALNEIRSSSNLQLQKFRPPGVNKSLRIDKFM